MNFAKLLVQHHLMKTHNFHKKQQWEKHSSEYWHVSFCLPQLHLWAVGESSPDLQQQDGCLRSPGADQRILSRPSVWFDFSTHCLWEDVSLDLGSVYLSVFIFCLWSLTTAVLCFGPDPYSCNILPSSHRPCFNMRLPIHPFFTYTTQSFKGWGGWRHKSLCVVKNIMFLFRDGNIPEHKWIAEARRHHTGMLPG